MNYWEYLILIFSVLLGGGIAFYVKQYSQTLLQMLLSFVGAYIMGITVIHLLPSVYMEHDHQIGLWILGGFFIQLILELLSGGVEHGHVHPRKKAQYGFALQILLGLCIHAFMEGLPLENYDVFQDQIHGHAHGHHHHHLLYGIILHKAPAAFVLVFLLSVSHFPKKFTIAALILFSLMSPLGAWSGGFLTAQGIITTDTTRILLALVIGSFLHIATTILFETESSGHHHISFKKLLMITLGLALAILTSLGG